MMTLQHFKQVFDPKLDQYIQNQLKHCSSLTADSLLLSLLNHLKKLQLHGGKRIRPYLAYLAYISSGGKNIQSIYPLLFSLEIFHTFCLVHDDIMDRGVRRHGVATIHQYALDRLVKKDRLGDLPHIANSQAILLGDLMFACTHAAFTDYTCMYPNQVVNQIFQTLIREVIVGQMTDVNLTTKPEATLGEIEQKMRLKTARYTFVGPLKLGFAVTDSPLKLMQFAEEFGTALGLAYQIRDDLLDIVALEQESDKTRLTDVRTRQHTVLTYFIFRRADTKYRQQLLHYFSDPAFVSTKNVIDLFTDSGAIKYGSRRMLHYIKMAQGSLDQVHLDKLYYQQFSSLITMVRNLS